MHTTLGVPKTHDLLSKCRFDVRNPGLTLWLSRTFQNRSQSGLNTSDTHLSAVYNKAHDKGDWNGAFLVQLSRVEKTTFTLQLAKRGREFRNKPFGSIVSVNLTGA